MSYPPPGGYPGYGPPTGAPYGVPPPGSAPYGGPPPGPTLGFDKLTIGPSPMGLPGGTPGYPPAGAAMPMPGQGPLTYGPPAGAPYMPSAPPLSGQMPTAPYPGGPQPGVYPYGQPPTAPLSFGAAAVATAAFPGHHRSHPPGPPMPMPNQGGMSAAPHHGQLPSTQPYGGMLRPPPHGGMPTAPPQGGMPTAPPHRGISTPPTMPAPSAAGAAAPKAPSSKPRGRPTITEYSPFDPEKDADVLRKAMKGIGCDSKAIIFLLCSRTNAQRQRVEKAYKTMHGRNLIEDLKSELGGHFEDVVIALMTPPAEYDASLLRKAIKGLGTDEDTLIEVVCSRSNAEVTAIKEAYRRAYDRDLEKDVAGDTSGHFKKFLISLLQANRDESDYVDRAKAQADAQALYNAGEKRWGTDESKFNTILVSRSFPHLRATFEEYSKICRYDIQESIKREMSGDLRDGMMTIVQIIRDAPTFFAEKLYRSMKGLGTDDKTLIRIVVTRSEVDLLDIKTAFQNLYHTTLAKYISDDTRGNYKKILLALLGNR